ncbi:MAG: hypothetical protein LC798_15400 [Chloroflexi bacterium]|nr:hypothetical protein [Chloroflexota bacterium]
MSARNGSKPPAQPPRTDRLKPGGGIAPDVAAWLERRTLAFQMATSGRGKPTTYGGTKREGKG